LHISPTHRFFLFLHYRLKRVRSRKIFEFCVSVNCSAQNLSIFSTETICSERALSNVACVGFSVRVLDTLGGVASRASFY